MVQWLRLCPFTAEVSGTKIPQSHTEAKKKKKNQVILNSVFHHLFFKKKLFIFIFLRWVFDAEHRLSLAAPSGGCSLPCGRLTARLLLGWGAGSGLVGLSSCGTWA